jgi:DNA (cytosine-5)-methyltransferase 1
MSANTSGWLTLADFSQQFGRTKKDLEKWCRVFGFESKLGPDGVLNYRLGDLLRFIPSRSPGKLDNKPAVISFFSGCGGLDLGFKRAGFGLEFANDFFLDAAATYSKNVAPIDPRSIYEIPESEVPMADVLLAGFPCQPFSNAGSRNGVADPRGTLFWETLRFVKSSRPGVVVFENVRGLLSMKNHDGSSLIESIEGEIAALGYRVAHRLINMADHGVPQNRFRVVIVGVKDELARKFGEFNFDRISTSKGKTVGEIISIQPSHSDPNDIHWALSPQAVEMIKHIPAGGSWKSVPYQELPERLKRIRDNMQKYHSPNFFRRFAPHEVMGTVTAAATPENSGIIHPLEDRRYTVREIGRFQTFPEKYHFLGTVSSQYKQIGNAVPPEFSHRLAKALKKQYFSA